MSPEEITLPDAPEPYPVRDTPDEPPADTQADMHAPIDPYADYTDAERLMLSKLDTLIVGMSELNAYAKSTSNGVNWIGTNFQTLLNTVSQLGAQGPMGLLKMLKGGA